MIREFAFGLGRRHYFEDSSNLDRWMNMDSDTFMSLYEYDEDIKDYYAKNKKLAGYTGKIYIPDEFILDVDGANPEDAQKKAIGLKILLSDQGIPYKAFFSGTGFHFHIPSTAFVYEPHKDLHIKVKKVLTEHGIFEYADPAVTDKLRLIRIPNTKNTKSNCYKVQLMNGMLEASIDEIMSYAKQPRELNDDSLESLPVFDALIKEKKGKKKAEMTVSQGRSPDPSLYPCISSMLESIPMGKRHTTALRLGAWFRWRYPEDVVRGIMEQWRFRVSRQSSEFSKKELDGIITNCYEGHNGEGYRYGCSDAVMDEHCKNTCRLYRNKKSQSVMDSVAMEDNLIEFYKSDVAPLNIGHLYGSDFPVYPGEVVILQAPPKSMKTMLLQNWMTAFKVPTYFLEMEMSPRQIWSRFVMIEQGWSEEELKNHYRSLQNGQDKNFQWLMVNFSAIPARDLEKTIMTLPVKPRIVVVDHMGLFHSNLRDPNMQVEEASQAMMELAVKHNLIVFAVSEINKTSMREGINIASAKGSFRTAYNANKILSLLPLRSREQRGVLEKLHLRCEANREREHLDVMLKIDNVRITLDDEEDNARAD
jgi:hypothetical protein